MRFRFFNDRTRLGERSTFRLKIDGRVAIRGFYAGVAEPVADRDEVDAGVEHVHRGAVTNRVGVDAFSGETRSTGVSQPGVLPEEIADAEASEGLAAGVAKEPLCRVLFQTAFAEHSTPYVCGLWPKGTDALLPTFSSKTHLKGPLELEVRRSDIENLLHACSRVEKCDKEGVVAATVAGAAIDSVEQRAELVRLQVFNHPRAASLDRYGQEPLTQREVLGVAGGDEADEGMDGRKSGVARGCAVVTLGLQMQQEGHEVLRRHVHQVEGNDLAAMVGGKEAEQKNEGIAVAVDGMRAEAADEGHVFGEEDLQFPGEFGGARSVHWTPPGLVTVERKREQWRSNRSLAAWASASRHVR